MAKALWPVTNATNWVNYLTQYDDAVAACGKDKLPALESWFQTELPNAIRTRDKPHLTKDELVRLVDWKLTRGKWRPRLLDFAKQQGVGVVEKASEAAFAALQLGTVAGAKEALAALTKLKGVGPATASAALAAASDQVPFMSDEALEAVVGGRDYTVKEFQLLNQRVREKAATLSAASGREWTARDVEKALWAAEVLTRATSGQGKKGKASSSGSKPAGKAIGAAATSAEEGAGGGDAAPVGVKRAADEQVEGAGGVAEGGPRRSRRKR